STVAMKRESHRAGVARGDDQRGVAARIDTQHLPREQLRHISAAVASHGDTDRPGEPICDQAHLSLAIDSREAPSEKLRDEHRPAAGERHLTGATQPPRERRERPPVRRHRLDVAGPKIGHVQDAARAEQEPEAAAEACCVHTHVPRGVDPRDVRARLIARIEVAVLVLAYAVEPPRYEAPWRRIAGSIETVETSTEIVGDEKREVLRVSLADNRQSERGDDDAERCESL